MTLKEFFQRDRFAAMIGAELIEIRQGYARARILVTPEHLNGAGQCQGGAIFTLADLAYAAAVNSHLTLTVAISTNITYVGNVSEGYIYAEATELVNHRRVPFTEVRITGEDGRLLAIFTSTGYRKQSVVIEAELPAPADKQ